MGLPMVGMLRLAHGPMGHREENMMQNGWPTRSRNDESERVHFDIFKESSQKIYRRFLIIHSVDKMNLWHRLPVFLGLIYLAIRRHLHQQYNLINVGTTPKGVRFNPADHPYRTDDGEYNDPFGEGVGAQDSFFGRNNQPVDQTDELMKPDPVVVAVKLLSRKKFIDTGKQFNMIAASWIQFMIHDWIDHLEQTNQLVRDDAH
ncbi:Alpha-dioxygenase 1 [Acorus calamus]|uniref:Alpha-dioxygenase 1 n=1 Tax=Acorus calamus TaxID=4465 RepID=A0AAV9EW68_ACOCL|nr:Alpha-dioxygenase 1 [Acorus calamus]